MLDEEYSSSYRSKADVILRKVRKMEVHYYYLNAASWTVNKTVDSKGTES